MAIFSKLLGPVTVSGGDAKALTRMLTHGRTSQAEAEQAAIQAAAASLAHYEKTGLHTTLDEVKVWAKAVRKNRSAKMPACHT